MSHSPISTVTHFSRASLATARPAALPQSWMAEIAREFAARPALWRDKVRPDPERSADSPERWFLPLYIGDRHEIWIQGWPPGVTTELHDHGGCSGAMAVITGSLTEVFIDGAHRRRRRLPAGSLVTFGPDHVHDVAGRSRQPALSIHVYSPRLESMTFYEFSPLSGLVALRTEHDVHDAAISDHLGSLR